MKRQGKWCWWSRDFSGYSALDYLIKVKEYNFMKPVKILAVSVYGIFFSDDSEGITMQQVVRQSDDEYDAEFAMIKEENKHEIVRISGDRADWKEVLVVYSVRVSMEAKDPTDIISIDEEKIDMIREVFWVMNELDSEIKKVTIEDEKTGRLPGYNRGVYDC